MRNEFHTGICLKVLFFGRPGIEDDIDMLLKAIYICVEEK